MARQFSGVLPFVLCAGLYLAYATAQDAAPPSPETYDVHAELAKLEGWKTYLLAEVDKHKAEVESAQAALQAEQTRVTEFTSIVELWKKASADAEGKAAAAEARAVEAEKKAMEAEALATSHSHYSSQLSAQIEQLKQDLAAVESRATARASAADASNGEAALLRKQLAQAVAERQAMDDRVAQLASATTKAGGLRGHALAIYEILLEEVVRHRENALNYANEKLPGFKAKVAEVHAIVSSQMPNVTGHVSKFVGNVDRELRPWLRQALGSVVALKPYSEDPVLLQALVYMIIGAPVLLLLLPLLSAVFRFLTRRPSSSNTTGRPETKSSRRNKRKQG